MTEMGETAEPEVTGAEAVQDGGTVVLRPDADPLAEPPKQERTGRSSADDYAICGKIGDGGMGVVYLARDRLLGRYVAIKRLNEKALEDPVLRRRFLHEARAVAALNHAYIVHIYALGEDALGPYIVMEYVSGPAQTEVLPPEGAEAPPPKNLTLEQFINRQGPMTADEAVAMTLKIARTMVYAHGCGVIHRDLKPANILLDPSQEPKLVDFGLARVEARDGHTPMAELTVPGEKLISLGYSAPELEQDASTSDGRADIYSMGAILYFLLTGRNPRYYREQDVPTFLREVLRRSLETVREQRYRSAQDFVRALNEAASHGRIVAPTVKTTWRCKWCDAVNPISTKFCAECGWDGSEHCLECNAETFVGQQFCPSCGADCRMYEHVSSIVRLFNQAWDERRFDRLSSIAGRLHGFEPAGPTGRALLSETQARVEEAGRKMARRNRLAALIPAELKAENFERAQVFIEEFRALNEDPEVYDEVLRELPVQILNRDLVRIRQAIRTHDWTTARELMGGLSVKYGSMPEFQDVRQQLARHDRVFKRVRWIVAAAAVVLLYGLSMPWMARLMGGSFGPFLRGFYAPAYVVSEAPGLAWLTRHYVRWCDDGRALKDYFGVAATPEEVASEPSDLPSLPEDLQIEREEFEAQLGTITVRRQTQGSSLLVQYRQGLEDFRTAVQNEGDYEGVMAAERAIEDYKSAEGTAQGAIYKDDPVRLVALKRRVSRMRDEQAALAARQIIAAKQRYLAALEEVRRVATQRGDMAEAGNISAELQRVRLLPSVIEAREILEKMAPKGVNAPFGGAGIEGLGVNTELPQLSAHRKALTEAFSAFEQKVVETLGNWQQQYTAALQTLMKRFKQSGNFNAWEATLSEVSRFDADHTLQPTDIVEHPEELRQTQEIFCKRLQEAYATRDSAKRAWVKQYLETLEQLKSDLTKRGEMESAAAVNQELRKVRQSAWYIALYPQTAAQPARPAAKPAPATISE